MTTDGFSFTFPAHAEPLVREALKLVVERIPMGWTGPMREVVILPVTLPFTVAEDDTIPEPASGVAEDDNA